LPVAAAGMSTRAPHPEEELTKENLSLRHNVRFKNML